METDTAAATVPTIVPALNARTAVITATNAINVNQSDSKSHTQLSSGSGNCITSTTSSSNSNSNINSSNSNSSSSSCSTSSNSSGYGSTTTTPTNNYETHQQQHTPTPIQTPTTPVATSEPVIPVATVAAVTPYYNEAITTHNLEIQHQQQQQQYHHQQQQQQHHLQQSFQHHQYLQRQQYYAPYDYPQQTPNLSSPTTYNLSSGIPYDISSSTASASGAYAGGQYKSSSLSAINYERNAAAARPVAAASSLYTHQVHTTEQPKTGQNLQLHQPHQQQFAKQRSSASLITSTNTTGSKPQAAATAFYAQPLPQHSNPATFYDNLKHKIPLEYHDTYTNPSSATYHQQQKYYAAAKSQLKETTYGSSALSSKSLYPNTTNFYAGSTVNHGYDKYVYPHATANAYSSTGHLTNETSPDTSYRKTAVANTLSSPTWPWGIEYASGNSRTIPPPNTHLPTATVAPTHATYLTSNPSGLSRDPYYMHHDKFNVKYDKYSASACPPSYQQTYGSPPGTRHHMWPSSHGPQLTQLNDRHHLATGPTAPPPHALHSSPYFSTSTGSSALNARQSCFSQPYQTQSCYYPSPNRLPLNQAAPPVAQSATYITGQQLTEQSSHLNTLSSSCKYGGMTENGNKLKTPNDLYVTSPYDINNAALNYGYGSNQIFNPNAHQSLNHGPSPAFTHEPLAVNPAAYTNDLNPTSSNYNNYPAHHYDSHLTPAPLGVMHSQPQQQPPQYAPTVAKRALLDYRKPIQPQPPPIGQEESYPALTTAARDQYNQQDLLNTPETTSAFAEYEVNQEVARITHNATSVAIRETEKTNEEENKNLSLRDFIANWNDDEDEYNNTEDLNFEQTAAVINEVLQATPIEEETQKSEIEQPKSLEVFKSVSLKDAPKCTDSFTTDALNEIDSGQYVNLPDIIIDIEKSNNANNSIASPLSTLTTPSMEVDNNTSLILSNFDVEKELDQLKMQKAEEKLETIKDLIVIKENCVTTPQLSPCKGVATKLSFENLNLEQPTKTVSTSTRSMASQSTTTDTTTEQYFKDIEGYDSGNSRHSNESAFEKEYETFIHKITSESTSKTISDSVKASPETESDFEQNVQDFSKFYKRKRKLKEDELKSLSVLNQNPKKMKSNSVEKVNTSNFPKVYTKKSRNRQLKVKQHLPRKRKPLSAYYKIIHSLRRYRLNRIKRVRDYITELKEKHLPLIKRQSIKNYSHCKQENSSFNPNSLKTLSILAINTEEFRQSLMLGVVTTTDDSLKSEERHICIDPTCETCEVIKSLMEPESFQYATINPESLDLYKIPENHLTTLPILPEVTADDVEQIVVAKEMEAELSLPQNSNENNFETQMVDSAALLEALVTEKSALLTTTNKSSLSPLQDGYFLISDKSEHQISNEVQLPVISNNSLNNAVETKPGYLKSLTLPDVENQSLESKSNFSPQKDDLEVSKNDQDQIDKNNFTYLEVPPEEIAKDGAINVETLENSNIDLNYNDYFFDKAPNLKMNKNYCEELIKVLELELPNQSQKLYDTIEDDEPFQNASTSLESFENSNENENLIQSDISSNFEIANQSDEKCITEPKDIQINSNSKDYKDTFKLDHNKEDSEIKTNSTENIKYVVDIKDDSELSDSDSDSSESDSESSSDSSDESTDDNKESRQINTDIDSSSDSDSETEDENSSDKNINRIAVMENVVDSTKESEYKTPRKSPKSPIQHNSDTNNETKEVNTKNISQLTLNENLIKISQGSTDSESVTAIEDTKQDLKLQNDSDSEWNDESDGENIEISSENETRSSSCNSTSSVKMAKEERKKNSVKLLRESKNRKLSNDDSRLSQSNIDNISVTIIENKVGANKILIKFTTPLVDGNSKVKESDSDSNYDYNSETDDDDIDMDCNTRFKCANNSSQVLRASQTLLQNTLEFLHTPESKIAQTNQQMPLDFLKFTKDPEESKTDSIVISDDETMEVPENIDEHPKENLQPFQDPQKSKADLTVICDGDSNGIAKNANAKESISIKILENLECHKNVCGGEKSEKETELKKESKNESVNFDVDNLNQIDGEPQFVPEDLGDLKNNSIIAKGINLPVSVDDHDNMMSENVPNNSSNLNKESENNSNIARNNNLPVAVEYNDIMASENLSNNSSILNKDEIQDHSCIGNTIENELVYTSRNGNSTKDLTTIDEVKQNEKEFIVFNLSLPSASNVNISEEKVVKKINLLNFKPNEDPEILTQEMRDESPICSVDPEKTQCLTETCESLNEVKKDNIPKEASSDENNVLEYNFSEESDKPTPSLITQLTSNVKEMINEDELKKNLLAKSNKDSRDDVKVQSPLKQLETSENINIFNDEPKEELKQDNIENEEKSHKCIEEIPRSPDYLKDAVSSLKRSENLKTNDVSPKTNAERLKNLANESNKDDKSEYITDNLIISVSSTNIEMHSDKSKSVYEKDDFKTTENLMKIDEIPKNTDELSLGSIEIKENTISSNMAQTLQTTSHIFEENDSISKPDSDISYEDNSNNSKITEYLWPSKANSKLAFENLDINEVISESVIDKPLNDETASESTIRDSKLKKFDIFEKNVTKNRNLDITGKESKQNNNILEYITKKKSEQNNSKLELNVDESESTNKISKMNLTNEKSDAQVSEQEPPIKVNETCLESTIVARTLCNESDRNITNSEPTRCNKISNTLAKDFNENETPRIIMEKESELIDNISAPPCNSCEGNIFETTSSIPDSKSETELNTVRSTIADQNLSNESEKCNKNSEPRNNATSKTLAKECNLNETRREIVNESELIEDISEPQKNLSKGNIINAVASILDSEQESELKKPSSSDRTLCNKSDQNNGNLLETKDDEIYETVRETADEEFELIDVNSEPSSNSYEAESEILISKPEYSINKSVLNETCAELVINDRTLSNESDENNTRSESTLDDDICKTFDKEFHFNEIPKDHTFLETHIETMNPFSDSITKKQTLVISTIASELNKTTTNNRSAEIQNEEPELIQIISESSTEFIISECKESGLNTTAVQATINLDDGNEVNSFNKMDSKGEVSKNIHPNFTDTSMSKESITEDVSGDFYGFKNQSSFEDESGDFHGFEDIEEERRIRLEIENLKEDSAANDGFLHSTLSKESHTSSKTSLAGSTTSEINELEALEKELSQHQVEGKHLENDETETDTNVVNAKNEIISTNDIEHIKKMLESDEEPQPDETEYQRMDEEREAEKASKQVTDLPNGSNSSRSSSIEILNAKSSVIPKLSVLCRAALNSSLHVNNLTIVQNVPNQTINDDNTPTTLVEREVTVEEALAEMYRQAGVLLSDPEDCDNDTPKTTTFYNEEAQDVLLFNLQEILNSDNDIYVLQCDMNDKMLNVVEQTNENDANEASPEENTERVNTLQFISIFDTDNSETRIHILSSDSESEVIILSDDDGESVYEPLPPERHERVTIPFINDSDFNNDSLSDISTIHHEEIVPDNLNKFMQEEFYKYLHEKYVQRNISKYFYANRVLKKYKSRFIKKSRQ